jgi:hypothetical protein
MLFLLEIGETYVRNTIFYLFIIIRNAIPIRNRRDICYKYYFLFIYNNYKYYVTNTIFYLFIIITNTILIRNRRDIC